MAMEEPQWQQSNIEELRHGTIRGSSESTSINNTKLHLQG